MYHDVEVLPGKLFLLTGFLAYYNGHLRFIHIGQNRVQPVPLLLRLCRIALLHKEFHLLFPIFLNLVEHSDNRVFVNADDHSLAEKATSREMMRYVLGYFLQTVITFYDLKNAG